MSDQINRRRFLSAAAMSTAAVSTAITMGPVAPTGIGHNVPQEAPHAFADAIVAVV
jgi:hypothetical protein